MNQKKQKNKLANGGLVANDTHLFGSNYDEHIVTDYWCNRGIKIFEELKQFLTLIEDIEIAMKDKEYYQGKNDK